MDPMVGLIPAAALLTASRLLFPRSEVRQVTDFAIDAEMEDPKTVDVMEMV